MNDFPEAPTVAYTNIKTPSGFTWSYTMRGESGKFVIPQMIEFEKFCKQNNWEPQELRASFKKEAKPKEYADHVCPTCGAKVIIQTNKDGKKLEKCETQKYDFQTKSTTGCAYTKWL